MKVTLLLMKSPLFVLYSFGTNAGSTITHSRLMRLLSRLNEARGSVRYGLQVDSEVLEARS